MPIRTITVTTISCDGTHGSCPQNASIAHERPATVATSAARRAGWKIGLDVLCPSCAAAPVPALTSPVPVLPQAFKLAAELVENFAARSIAI